MYKEEQLSKYPYFKKVLESKELNGVLDSLTGVVLRPYIIGFINYLIETGTPFSVAMLDLDNFKFINDNYGHKVGDGVLSAVSDDLISYYDDCGVVGRFGGDEFILVNLRDVEYADIKIFFQTMYSNYNVMRKNIKLETCNPFITGTIGCASFPHDADNYDELFQLIDKTLYRGKTKGRNCYIIYLESKHKNLQIRELAKHGMYESLHNLVDRFEIRDNTVDKLRDMYNVLEEVLRITNLYYVDSKNVVHDIMGKVDEVPVSDISAVMTTDMFNTNSVDIINDLSPEFYGFLKKNEIEALLIVRIRVNHDIYGYLMCAEPRSLRIWQEDEAALLFFAARLLASYIRETGDGL